MKTSEAHWQGQEHGQHHPQHLVGFSLADTGFRRDKKQCVCSSKSQGNLPEAKNRIGTYRVKDVSRFGVYLRL